MDGVIKGLEVVKGSEHETKNALILATENLSKANQQIEENS
jgi:hypothetical protein